MTIFFVPFILSFSIVFTCLTHPVSVGIMLLIQTTLISISSGMNSPLFWSSYILFVIFLGGMLVLFIYVASLAWKGSFKLSLFLTIIILLSSFSMSVIVKLLDPSIFYAICISSTLLLLRQGYPGSMFSLYTFHL